MNTHLHHALPRMLFTAVVLWASACKPGHEATPKAASTHPEPATRQSPKESAPARADTAASVTVPPKNGNPVQNEMRVLHEATRDWVSAIANNTPEIIPASIGKVHEARMVTEEAVEAGAYKPPKNSDAMADFAKQDDAFHAELVKLLQASRAKDLPATTKQLGVVLEGCTSCHLRFRF